jgi:hypothetical protein
MGGFETFPEQVLVAGEDRRHAYRADNQRYRQKPPGASPMQRARQAEKQTTKDSYIPDDAED